MSTYDEDGYDDYYADDIDDGEQDCTHCGGDPLVECDDPLQCCTQHIGGWCQCRACNGTGLRSEQWIF